MVADNAKEPTELVLDAQHLVEVASGHDQPHEGIIKSAKVAAEASKQANDDYYTIKFTVHIKP